MNRTRLIGAILTLAFFTLFGAKELRRIPPFIAFLDVGQGDAILIQLEGGTTVLIDAGPDSTVVERVGRSLPFFDRTIEYAIATHPDADHHAGYFPLLKRYTIGHFLFSAGKSGTWELLLAQVRGAGAQTAALAQGSAVALPEGAALTVLWPPAGFSPANTNDASAVLLFTYGGQEFLLLGDAPKEVERRILAQYPELKADVVKLGHHGSRTSTSDALLKRIMPKFAVLSFGAGNRFGHPHKEVLEALARFRIPPLRTPDFGSVYFDLQRGDLTPLHLDDICLFC